MGEINNNTYDYSDNYFKGDDNPTPHDDFPLLSKKSDKPIKLFSDNDDLIPQQLSENEKANLIEQAKDYNEKRNTLSINLGDLLDIKNSQIPDEIYICREGAASSIDAASEAIKHGIKAKTLNGGFYYLVVHDPSQLIHNLRILSKIPQIRFTEYLYDDFKRILDPLEKRCDISISTKRTTYLNHIKEREYIYAFSIIPDDIKAKYINKEYFERNTNIETLICDIADLLPMDSVKTFKSHNVFCMCPRQSVTQDKDSITPVIAEKGIFFIHNSNFDGPIDHQKIMNNVLSHLESERGNNIIWVKDENLIPFYSSQNPPIIVTMIPIESYNNRFWGLERHNEYFLENYIQEKVIRAFFPENLSKRI